MNGVLANPKLDLTISAGSGSEAKRIEQTACLFTVANTPSFGGGLPIAPEARIDDGQFDCILAATMTKPRLGRAAFSLLRGTHLGLPEVHFIRATVIHLESDSPARVYADGEFVCETPCEVRIAPAALHVVSFGNGSSN
jgi:diacylglycerol kinase family enzyme